MEVDVHTAIDIGRTRGVVAAYASDPDNATTWYVNIKRVEWRSSKPLEVGSRIAFQVAVPRTNHRLHLRNQGVCSDRAAGDGDVRGTFPHGDELYLE